ncbi:BREX-3 system P-loop-containing protein BrxF [Dehalobacter sp.]|uniref:BREX-3 system P-loop-containing protein BrxF n=1 Tax=Dehalobacter sp. TaxID=1962289 RepID=UPI002587AD9D|nr:BREX-3 system P-loop-containing protein BrxF [Dehalobacter sp.]MDJ0306791.1 BREX-3 system P-loop-containing protein BrxF [Dehalobacter sp.]
MGAVLMSSKINKDDINKTTIPIILCSLTPRLNKIIDDSHYYELSLNKLLAEALVKKDISDRPQSVTDEIMKIIASIHETVILTDYEMLFDPRYKMDVIRLFYEISRRAKILVKWCGTINDNRLEYATPAHKDFHTYNIQDYDIICVI